MNDQPRQKLRELILYYGRSLCEDPRRCEALLKDHCGQHKREIAVLMFALKDQIPHDLLRSMGGIPPSLLQARLVRRLYDNLGIAEAFAAWAVESWMLALGLPVELAAARGGGPRHGRLAGPGSDPTDEAVLLGGRYRDHGDGTLSDVTTGLQWMRCALGQTWSDLTCRGESVPHSWTAALEAAERLNSRGGYAGHADWRVPTIDELRTLIYCSSGQPRLWNDSDAECRGPFERPTLYPAAFPEAPRAWFWSSSPDMSDPDFAWLIYFSNGSVNYGYKSQTGCLRLVRGA